MATWVPCVLYVTPVLLLSAFLVCARPKDFPPGDPDF